MSFDWPRFLNSHHIEYVERGPNVAKGNINVRCPWCSDGDPSHHLGISLNGVGYGCWRNSTHRGKAPQRLVQALLKCSMAEASRIVGRPPAAVFGADESLGEDLAALLGNPAREPHELPPLDFPEEIRPITHKGFGVSFLRYLETRHYTPAEAQDLCHEYALRFAVSGPFAYRLVIPVEMPGGLANWTGRSVSTNAKIRYKSLSSDPDKAKAERLPVARANVKDCLFNLPSLLYNGGECLAVTEGPFDALRVDYFGKEIGLRATCLFSKTISKAQEEWLGDLSPRFKRRILVVDGDAQVDAFLLYQQLERFGFSYKLLNAKEDPAELSPRRVRALAGLANHV
jgi:hypothetical protein